MKKILILGLGLAMLNLTSCKKGENDPGISLKSRKSRLTGEWDVEKSSYTYTSTNSSDGYFLSESGSVITNGNSLTSTYSSDGNYDASSGTINENTIVFEKDGTYEITNNNSITTSEDYFEETLTLTVITNSLKSGSWSFAGKDDEADYKNKERVLLNETSSSETNIYTISYLGSTETNTSTSNKSYENGEMTSVYVIDMLKNEEMKIVGEINNNSTTTDSWGTSISTEIGEIEMELTKN